MMRVVGVLDLAGGRAVHAAGGDRGRYEPVTTVAGVRLDAGDALAVARTYLDALDLTELYVADLDAIEARSRTVRDAPATLETPSQDKVVTAIAALGATLWLDAGVTSARDATQARDLGASKVVVGLETLPSYDALSEVCSVAGTDAAFSLDLRNGVPVVAAGFRHGESAEVIAARAAGCGAASIIVIDLARVGSGAGLDLGLIARLRAAAPDVSLFAGGGVRGGDDLARLAGVGCDGALVATALHDGRLTANDVRAARQSRLTR